MAESHPAVREPKQGERFWPKDGTDTWHKIFSVKETPGSPRPDPGVFLIRSFSDTYHLVTFNETRRRWEEINRGA